MIERLPMSKTGHQKLRDELQHLERVERGVVVKAIEVAREHGDLKENAEYHAAKDRQGHIEGRIIELKDKLSRAEVIDCTRVNTNMVVFGTIVELLDLDTEEEVVYQLLGPEEADVKKGSISVLSPIGRSMLGKEIGDEVIVVTPGGKREFEVVKIGLSDQP
ncbi:transcription elongation factor GreA [Desulforhopalus sp. IMCC35007]|uniref:transcription elongation factor GreA n=1 Tax=Desulforhopalus sp. IMCC35007 TaxID=2569543 RepID=UPI0010AE1F6B|nr:transcription elongation factor GreA [Desulforhopalus sp. IMCC35007]TKB10342.1 transcription elongation factor GreA [Desulforhopalus sp. IMCC35007]